MSKSVKKIKVLVLYNKLFHYRIPIFNLLAERYDLTVAYSLGKDGDIPSNVKFKTIHLDYYKCGRFILQKANMYKFCSNYDAVLLYGEIAWLKNTYLTLRTNRPFVIIPWSIGVSASYNHSFDRKTIWSIFTYFIKRRADALVFYSDYPIKKYLDKGFSRDMLFVANNTVEVHQSSSDECVINKDSILFIGTLYMQKGIAFLLEEYLKAYNINNSIPTLNLVGGGKELDLVHMWVKKHNMEHKINVCGPIYDLKEKSNYFARAYATFSPIQAGLSVLESMGYGVPFVTTKTAITGGEIFNIENGINGILLDDCMQIHNVILDIASNPSNYIALGKNAQNHYKTSRKPIDMANGLSEAIEYAYFNKKNNK